MAILAALNSAPIHRLNRTWALVSSRTMAVLDHLRNLMSPTKNFANYREMLKSLNPPCVPFLGFYLTDLTFIEDGNSDTTKSLSGLNLINFSKRSKTAEVIKEVQTFQASSYALTSVSELQEFLSASLHMTRENEDYYELSLLLEPKEREDEKIARLLHESGFL